MSRIDKDSKEARDKRIFDLWMQCYTQEQIAEKESTPQQTIADICKGFTEIGNFDKSGKAHAEHATDFETP